MTTLNRLFPGSCREAGQSYVEFIMVLPIFLLIIVGITGFGQRIYAKLAVDAAAWSACRHAIATIDQTRGMQQAFDASRYTLSGFGLNPNSAEVQVIVWGQWKRGTQVRTRVCYPVPAPPVPMGGIIAPSRVCSSQTMPVYRWKSKWQ